MAKELTQREKRCQDCACLISKNGVYCCDECFGQACEDIDECPEGIKADEVEQINEKAKSIKIDHGASSVDKTVKKQSKPRTVKVSDEKTALFSEIFADLYDVYRENAQIVKENKLITVKIGEKTFKIDIIETRNKK